jgi:DNA-binding MarR family transcriptional regulator
LSELGEKPEFSLDAIGEFLRSLWELNHLLERASRCTEALHGVTGQQRMMVRFVGKYPGLTVSRLASHFHLDPGTVSIALRRLEQKGLVERRRAAHDKRRVTLGLTALGRRVDAEVTGVTELAVRSLLKEAAPADLETTRRLLAALTGQLENEVERGRRELAERELRRSG